MKILFLFTMISSLIKPVNAAPSEMISYGKFGDVSIYRKDSSEPDEVVLFISGDGGWQQGVIEMADVLVNRGALVAGINISTYRKNILESGDRCVYAASDFENLSQYIQKKLNLKSYHIPILAGYSSGATLVYGLLAQAPVNTFKGGVSLGFCSDLNIGKILCRGSGLVSRKAPGELGYYLQPVRNLSMPWIVLDGSIDHICNTSQAGEFVSKVGNAWFVTLEKVGHGFSVDRNWVPELGNAYDRIVRQNAETGSLSPDALKDLPIHVMNAEKSSSNEIMAVMYSGDGGWAGLDQSVAKSFNDDGIPVVGMNSLSYFWSKRTPSGSALDLERILRYYSSSWHKSKIIMVGYSMGADVLPFMINRLPDDIRRHIVLVTLLSPSERIGFQFHLTDWINGHSKSDYYVLPEIRKMSTVPVLCLYGDDEKDSICLQLPADHYKVVSLPGGHHYDGDYRHIYNEIITHVSDQQL